MSENHSLLPNNDDESSYDELSDNSSCSNSYYSDSESSVPEWEPSLDASGRLLYIDCHPFVKHQTPDAEPKSDAFAKDHKLRQSTRSKFLKLLRRRDSKRRSKRNRSQDTSQDSSTASKVTFHDYEYGEVKLVSVAVNRDGRTAFGRRASLVENLLGVSVSSFPNGDRVMVAGFSTSGEKNEKIKIGDWLKAIQNVEVNIDNVETILERFSTNETVVLHLQRVAAVDINQDVRSDSRSKLVDNLLNYFEESLELFDGIPVGICYVNTENLSETDSEFQDVVYAFPKPLKQNVLCQTRGVFITLNHLLSDLAKSEPHVTSFLYKSRLTHVAYRNFKQNLLLLMVPDESASKNEIALIQAELTRNLEFAFESVDKCFNCADRKELDHFFLLFFEKTLQTGVWESENVNVKSKDHRFESVLPAAEFMNLPNEVQMQIDDALTEMEASDYRDWNEEPLDCQRLFTILGSALYHDGRLLASHFPHEDLRSVHSYVRASHFFDLLGAEHVRSLIHWREVFPRSARPSNPDERRYLLIVANTKDLLAVIMEAGGCTEPAEENMGPDAFYVEEVEATLSHVQELGIKEFADRWSKASSRSFLSDEKEKGVPSRSKSKVTSILKRRPSDQATHGSIFSLHEDDYSEDSFSERSETSDEPVVGRRAIREKKVGFGYDDPDSDVDDYREGSQLSVASYDLSELRRALLNETESSRPVDIVTGDPGILFNYVQFDGFEGVVLSLAKIDKSEFVDNFRCCCQSIHKLFRNTLRFKNMSAQDMAKSLMNKTLIAIKEYGTLFEYSPEVLNNKKPPKITYWVVGRLFYMPYPRELYVCYQDTVPQNLVDMAFRLGAM